MGKKSKTKGAKYELDVSKLLTEWWGGGKFSRVPASGGLHWGDDQRVAGDIIPPPEADFPFVVECKKREGWTMEHILLDIGQPREWWEQVVTDGRRVKLTPLMIFSRNRAKDFVMIPYNQSIFNMLVSYSNNVMITPITTTNIRDELEEFYVIVTTYETFTQVPIDSIRDYAKKVQWDRYNTEDE